MPEAKYGPVGALTPVEYEVERLRRRRTGWINGGVGPQTARELRRLPRRKNSKRRRPK